MRHRVSGRKLGRNTSQRRALFRGLATELFRHERITTTKAKAQAFRPYAERLITIAKNGAAKRADDASDVHERRLAVARLSDPAVARKLLDEIGPRFAERNGGYTRIYNLGPRKGDGAEMVVVELVD